MARADEIHRTIADLWNRRDWAGMRALLHPDYEYRGPDGRTTPGGPDAGVEMAKGYATAFPDGRMEIQRVIVQGSYAVAELLATGTNTGELFGTPATGKPLTLPICNVVEVRDGRVYREHEYFDQQHMLAQLGLVEPPK